MEIKGVLKLEWTAFEKSRFFRMRVIFYAEPKDPKQLPKSLPNYESVGAIWSHLKLLFHLNKSNHFSKQGNLPASDGQANALEREI